MVVSSVTHCCSRHLREPLHRSSSSNCLHSASEVHLQSGVCFPSQTPSLQASSVVQPLPSSQARVLNGCSHPDSGLQESSVQGFSSLHSSVSVPLHCPSLQLSPRVQASPSSQPAVLLACWQPAVGSQLSSVQAFRSSQSSPWPAVHAPSAQASSTVHALPSSHGAVLFRCSQPTPGVHLSVVQRLESSQSASLLHGAGGRSSPGRSSSTWLSVPMMASPPRSSPPAMSSGASVDEEPVHPPEDSRIATEARASAPKPRRPSLISCLLGHPGR